MDIPSYVQKGKAYAQQHKPVVYSGLILLIVILIIAFKTFSSGSPEEVIQDFSQAVEQGDADALRGLLSPDHEEMEVDEKKLKQYIHLMQTEQGAYEDQLQLLEAQKNLHDPKSKTSAGGSHYGADEMYKMSISEIKKSGAYYLKKEEGIFFDSYSIGVRPYYITVSTNKPGAVIKMDGEEVFKSSKGQLSKKIGPLMPGIYKLTGSKQFPYAKVKNKRTADLFLADETQRVTEVSLNLSGKKVEVESEFSDTEVYVNGKKVGVVKDLEEFGPVSVDGSVKIHGKKKFPWGESQSQEKKVTKDTDTVDLTPLPFSDKKGRKVLTDTVNTFAKERIQAQVKQKPSVLTVAGDNLLKYYTKKIEAVKESSWRDPLKGYALGTRIDYKHMEFSKEDGLYTITLPVEFHDKTNESEYGGPDKDNPLRESFSEAELTLKYSEKSKKWYVAEVDSLSNWGDEYFEGKDVVKSKFE